MTSRKLNHREENGQQYQVPHIETVEPKHSTGFDITRILVKSVLIRDYDRFTHLTVKGSELVK